jgi:hypothetical protein
VVYDVWVDVREWAIVLALGAVGCGIPETPPMPEGKIYPLSDLEQRFLECPEISTSDPSVSTCLSTSYRGEVPTGEDCSVKLHRDGSYEFSSPELKVSRAASAGTTFFFSHVAVDGYNSLTWTVSESATLDTASYRLSFEAEFGILVPDATLSVVVSEDGPTSRGSWWDVSL